MQKYNGNVHIRRMAAFNEFIAEVQLQELRRVGGKFTWTNKQENPVRDVLDRVFISSYFFFFSFFLSLLQAGSDHAPLLLVEGEDRAFTPYKFRFETAWLLKEN